jgi:predicted transcriptional regulator
MLTLLAQLLDPSEIAVMQLLWARGPMTVGEVCHTLPPERRLHYLTVLTTLRRLAEKQVLRREPLGAAAHAPYCYTPRLSRADVLAAAMAKLCDDLGAARSDHLSVVQHTVAAMLPR